MAKSILVQSDSATLLQQKKGQITDIHGNIHELQKHLCQVKEALHKSVYTI